LCGDCKKEGKARKKLVPFKKGTSFWTFLVVCTAFYIGSLGRGNLIPPNSPNLNSLSPESLGNSWGILGECTT
jgi:hypothetical protein